MKNQITAVLTITFIALALVVDSVSANGRHHRVLSYEYHFGDASPACDGVLPTDPPIPVIAGTPTCRPEAVAEVNPNVPVVPNLPLRLQGGGSIAIQGTGELSVSRGGKPRGVNGSGPYAIYSPNGLLLESGAWKARKLVQFDSYGPGTGLPPALNAGRAIIKIRLIPTFGRRSDALLEVGCRLGAANPGIPGTIEGVRVMVDGGLYYNLPADPKSTLFVDLN